MKKINWKNLIVSCIVCLLPVIVGVWFYNDLPDSIAVHFDINNNPDNYASKNFALFVIPMLMTLLQIFCCIIIDIRSVENSKEPKFVAVVRWIIPILSIAIYSMMIQVALGNSVDVGRIVCLILGMIYIIMGNYLPKTTYENMKGKMNPMPKSEKIYKKFTRVAGYTFVIFGILIILSLLLKPIYSILIIIIMVVVIFIELMMVNKKEM